MLRCLSKARDMRIRIPFSGEQVASFWTCVCVCVCERLSLSRVLLHCRCALLGIRARRLMAPLHHFDWSAPFWCYVFLSLLLSLL